MPDYRKLTRPEIAEFARTQRAIRFFELLQDQIIDNDPIVIAGILQSLVYLNNFTVKINAIATKALYAIPELVTAYDDGLISVADKIKLDGIEVGATKNETDLFLLGRANHIGTQSSATISDFDEATDNRVSNLLVAGSNITLTYDDLANTLTVAATGGGSSTGLTHQEVLKRVSFRM
jgi:hypothetical protein